MLKEQEWLIHKTAIIVDAVIVALSFLIAYVLRDIISLPFLRDLPPFKEYFIIMVFVVPLWIILLEVFGVYEPMREKKFSMIFWSVLEASIAATLIFSMAAFLFKLEFLSRAFVMIFFASSLTLLVLEKGAVLLFLRKMRKKGFNFRVMLIVGSGARSAKFAKSIEDHPELGIKILGFIDEKEMLGKHMGSSTVIGTLSDLARILDENMVDEVVFIMPRKWLDGLEKYIKICEKTGVKATIAIDFFDTAIAKPVVKDMLGWPLLTLDSTPHNLSSLSMKRSLDLLGSGLGLLLLSPLFLVIAAAIKLNSRGPVFFRQARCGLHGRQFMILKFRTMVMDAEQKLKDLRRLNELEGPVFKIKDDPRITVVGRLLRKTSLDELPQLINVFKGAMSLVGPRPPLPSEVERYERWQRRRLSMRPGITCIHEVEARNNKDFDVWMKMDLDYIDNWSFRLDFRILIKTVVAVVRGTGC
jgi:exopolysaccharide biosynthesis polyprenyl glycosylphosphotransferase